MEGSKTGMGSSGRPTGPSGRGDGDLDGAPARTRATKEPADKLPSTSLRAGGTGLNDRILLLTNGMTIEAAEGYCMRQAPDGPGCRQAGGGRGPQEADRRGGLRPG